MENMMLGDVLGSPSFLNILKLQAIDSDGFANHAHEVLPHEHNVCQSSSSVNSIHSHYAAVPTEQALHHITSQNSLLPVLSSTSSPSFNTAADDVALINLLAHAESANLAQIPCNKEEIGHDEELAPELLRSLTACFPFARPQHSPHSLTTTMIPSMSQGSGTSSNFLSPCNILARKHVQDDPYGCFTASDGLLFLKDHNSTCPNISSYMKCLMANSGAELYTASSLDPGGSHQNMAAALSTSSSSSTPSSMSKGVTQLANDNLQAAWAAFESSPFNPALRDLCDMYEGKVALNIQMQNGNGLLQHIRENQKSSTSDNIVSSTASAMAISTHEDQRKKAPKRSRKRKRMSQYKNVEEMETQRMTHIAVERNRRKQMNEHLRSLRQLMPPSYIQRGDQASIVGGTIRFVEELEQLLQSLWVQRQVESQYNSRYEGHNQQHLEQHVEQAYANTRSCVADVEVSMPSLTTAYLKVLAQKRPHQLFHTLLALSKLSLRVTYLNITTVGIINVYTFKLETDGDGQLLTPLGLAESIQHIFLSEVEAKKSTMHE